MSCRAGAVSRSICALAIAIAFAVSTSAISAGEGPTHHLQGSLLHGRASIYANRLDGLETASGERYDADAMTAAHRTLPLGSTVRVVDRATKRSVVVRINDRGPFAANHTIDLSRSAARALGIGRKGVADVTIQVLDVPTRPAP